MPNKHRHGCRNKRGVTETAPRNISGTNIQIGKVGADFQLLNFHLLEDQLTGSSTLVTITEKTFTIAEGLVLSFDSLDGME